MSKTYLALYKGRKSGRGLKVWLARVQDWIIRTVTRSPYSHCEIAVNEGIRQIGAPVYTCYSASARDGGVRSRMMTLPADKWDLVELPPAAADTAEAWYRATFGEPYNYAAAIGAVFGRFNLWGRRGRWFCSQWCAYVLNVRSPESQTPARLARRYGLPAKRR